MELLRQDRSHASNHTSHSTGCSMTGRRLGMQPSDNDVSSEASAEVEKQQRISWTRSETLSEYNRVLGFYEGLEALRHCRGDSALDLACGDGLLTAMLHERFRRLVGVEVAAGQLERAKQRLPAVEFHQSLIEDLALDETFDTVLMLGVLHHVLDPQVALRRAASFVRPGGVLIVHVPNANAVNRRLAVLMGTLERCDELSPFDVVHFGVRRSYTVDTIRDEVQKAGLRVLSITGVFYKMLSGAQMTWFLENGLWEEGGYGWGRVGGEKRDWKAEFCRACYELGRDRPEDTNMLCVVAVPESSGRVERS
jgi:2-polyprenyl-3-methyl-5-hydroxy-6-metoxy-1,4-benzoquinol methylase